MVIHAFDYLIFLEKSAVQVGSFALDVESQLFFLVPMKSSVEYGGIIHAFLLYLRSWTRKGCSSND